MTSSNGNIFRVTGHLCGEFTGPRWIPARRPVTQSFDISFYLRLNKRLDKQSWGWWFETLSHPLWRHRNEVDQLTIVVVFLNDMDEILLSFFIANLPCFRWLDIIWCSLCLPSWSVIWDYLSIPKLQGIAEVWEWINYLIPHFIMDVITYPYWD